MRLNKFITLLTIASISAFSSDNTYAQSCTASSITKPSPFMGNNDEIFTLLDGSIWQVKYEHEYLYEYYPDVIICPSQGVLIINEKKLNVVSLSKSSTGSVNSGNVIESKIDGDFHGWDGETIYKLRNGQTWQQSSYHYHYHYSYSPNVLIYREDGSYKMVVEGDNDQPISVRKLN